MLLSSFPQPYKLLRFAMYGLFFGALVLTGAQGQDVQRTLRIGLRTKQATVQLQGTVPLRVEAGGVKLATAPAGQPLTFTLAANQLHVSDPDGKELATADGRVQVRVDPEAAVTRPRDADAPPPTPLIKLLGPTRHYDAKPDRPYRGTFELIPTDAGLTVVNIVGVEEYLLGVVSSEMSPRYPMEALKAQAVAARTYALKNRGRFAEKGYDLDDTPASQVYGGVLSEDPRTTQAVNETAAQVLVYDGNLVDAVYSSTCGGYTESAAEAWGRAVPYLTSVPDLDEEAKAPFAPKPATEAEWAAYFKSMRGPRCLQPKYANPEAFRWVRVVTRKDLEAGLPQEYQVGTVQDIVPLRRGESGRITALRIEGTERSVTIEKELPIRKALGGLRSSAFTVDGYRDDNGKAVVFIFWGGGWGHGLGMCQVGALGLADDGWTYDKILTHYYQGATLERR